MNVMPSKIHHANMTYHVELADSFVIDNAYFERFY